MIWKNKAFWREPTDSNKIYIHPILAMVGLVAAIALDVYILVPIITTILGGM